MQVRLKQKVADFGASVADVEKSGPWLMKWAKFLKRKMSCVGYVAESLLVAPVGSLEGGKNECLMRFRCCSVEHNMNNII